MVDNNKLLDHNYDGIEEFDNDLPSWWVYLFWITVIYGALYAVWFHSPATLTPEERLSAELKSLQAAQKGSSVASTHARTDSEIQTLVSDESIIKNAKGIYAAKCAACHGMEGQGVIGPNLTDEYWIHGSSPSAIRNIIAEGVLAKGMLSWKGVLSADEIDQMVAFILSLKGSNPANPKGPEGTNTN